MTAIILLSVIGIIAVIAELILPGGILGVVGFLCLGSAVVMVFIEYGLTAGAISVVVLAVLGFLTLGSWMKFFHRLPVTRKLILKSESGEDADREEHDSLVGETGITVTDLTPSGHAKIAGKKRDVMTEASSIPKGTEVEIVALRGPSIIVRALDRSS